METILWLLIGLLGGALFSFVIISIERIITKQPDPLNIPPALNKIIWCTIPAVSLLTYMSINGSHNDLQLTVFIAYLASTIGIVGGPAVGKRIKLPVMLQPCVLSLVLFCISFGLVLYLQLTVWNFIGAYALISAFGLVMPIVLNDIHLHEVCEKPYKEGTHT